MFNPEYKKYFDKNDSDLRNAYRIFLHVDCEDNGGLQNVCTPYDLCEKIIKKTNKYRRLKGKKILVVNLEFAIVLLERGHEPSDICFLTDCEQKAKFGKMIGVEVMSEDFFDFFERVNKEKEVRTWDYVIGNPPYQDFKAKSSKKTWKPFLRTSIDILKDGGIVAFITPFSWGTPVNDIFDVFQNNQVHFVNLDDKKYFPNVGTTISWYVIQKNNEPVVTEFLYNEEIINIDLKNVVFLPSDMNKETINILKKFLSHSEKLGIQYDFFCEQRKPIMSKVKDEQFKYPVKHTASQILYSSVPHPNTKIKKVIFPISSSMKAEYDGNGKYGCSQHYAWIKVENKKEGDAVISFLNSEIIKWLRRVTHWSASWSRPILDLIPNIPKNKCYTNKEIYKIFDISDNEQKHIQKSL